MGGIQVTTPTKPIFDHISPGGSIGCPVYAGWTNTLDMQTDKPMWKIAKLFYDADFNFTHYLWADGDSFYDNVWDDRTSLTYR